MQVDQWRKRRCVVIVNETAAKQYNEIINPFDYWVFILCAYHATDSWNLEYYMFLNFRISLTVYIPKSSHLIKWYLKQLLNYTSVLLCSLQYISCGSEI